MRKAGDFVDDPELFQTIWKHLKSDGMPDQAANQLTAEMLYGASGELVGIGSSLPTANALARMYI